MKKYLQIFVVVALVLTIVGIAGSDSAWAGKLFAPQPKPASDFVPADLNYAMPYSIVITGSGSYLVGGVCKVDVEYKGTGLKDDVDAEVPVSESSAVPFSGEGELFYPGCHIVHSKAGATVAEASADDGSWNVCFAQRPDVEMKIYYYQDGASPVWQSLPTTSENGFACASALSTGVYMPSGIFRNHPGGVSDATIAGGPAPAPVPGTVQSPPPSNTISTSGSFSVGGVCSLIVQYKVEQLSDRLYVEVPVQDDHTITFPGTNGDLLFLPGCHVLHYEQTALKESMASDKGTWKICFAAPPNKTMTIYFYKSMAHSDNIESVTPPWQALATTMENGMACAIADGTGVYVPAGK